MHGLPQLVNDGKHLFSSLARIILIFAAIVCLWQLLATYALLRKTKSDEPLNFTIAATMEYLGLAMVFFGSIVLFLGCFWATLPAPLQPWPCGLDWLLNHRIHNGRFAGKKPKCQPLGTILFCRISWCSALCLLASWLGVAIRYQSDHTLLDSRIGKFGVHLRVGRCIFMKNCSALMDVCLSRTHMRSASSKIIIPGYFNHRSIMKPTLTPRARRRGHLMDCSHKDFESVVLDLL